MGELGATVIVYPPGWLTLPVGIFALTIVLATTTLAVPFALSRVPNRATTGR
jgi:2-aminoethylphosphonate transport system permease protein